MASATAPSGFAAGAGALIGAGGFTPRAAAEPAGLSPGFYPLRANAPSSVPAHVPGHLLPKERAEGSAIQYLVPASGRFPLPFAPPPHDRTAELILWARARRHLRPASAGPGPVSAGAGSPRMSGRYRSMLPAGETAGENKGGAEGVDRICGSGFVVRGS